MSVSSEFADQLVIIHTPNVNDTVRPAGRQVLIVRRNFNRLDLLTAQRERVNQVSLVEQIAYLNATVVRGADQQIIVRIGGQIGYD